jgi:hypothetical protein
MDRVREALVAALRQALAGPDEHRLYRAGKLEGLFASRAGVSGEAAAQALAQELLVRTRSETRGKVVIEWVRLSPAGVDFLHQHESPVRALDEVRHALRSNQEALPGWLAEMRATLAALDERLAADACKWSERLDGLTRRVEDALKRLESERPLLPPEVADAYPWSVDALNYLDRRKSGGAPGDCPLPELFAALTRTHSSLSVGTFHDGLRRLHDRRVLRLKPAADGSTLTQPEFALFDGGAVLYHAGR